MNSLTLKRLCVPQSRFLYQVRNASEGYWNKDWMPGQIPKTEEDRVAAAKKYNLLPEEYQTADPSNGFGAYGDYPKLPDVGAVNKDIYYPYDFPEYRKNFGEPMHENSIFYTEDRVDPLEFQKLRYPVWKMMLALVGFCLFVAILPFTPFKLHPPVARRQFPEPGVVHYSYEPVD